MFWYNSWRQCWLRGQIIKNISELNLLVVRIAKFNRLQLYCILTGYIDLSKRLPKLNVSTYCIDHNTPMHWSYYIQDALVCQLVSKAAALTSWPHKQNSCNRRQRDLSGMTAGLRFHWRPPPCLPPTSTCSGDTFAMATGVNWLNDVMVMSLEYSNRQLTYKKLERQTLLWMVG